MANKERRRAVRAARRHAQATLTGAALNAPVTVACDRKPGNYATYGEMTNDRFRNPDRQVPQECRRQLRQDRRDLFGKDSPACLFGAEPYVEQHHDAIYCNAIYSATPKNYRAAVVKWMTAFGKVAFDAVKLVFTYTKGKKSDLPAALIVSPADYEKAQKSTETKAKAPLVDRIGKIADATLDNDDASQEDKNFALFMATQIKKYREMTAKAKPAATTSNVVEIKQAETKPVAGEEKVAKEAAPKASRPKVAKPEADKDVAPASTIKRIKVDRDASDRLASAAA